jgi:putative transposase
MEQRMVLEQVKEIRKTQPAIGTRKLYFMLQPFLIEHEIKMGRDGLFNLLAAYEMLVRRRKRRVFTTQSHHWLRKYPNLIKCMEIMRPNQLWVADITYYKIAPGYIYISLITDAYSHKIVGYHLADNLEAANNIKALEMALNTLASKPCMFSLIHHSDRGIQYCSKDYVRLLESNHIAISMTEDGNPLENAIAERINGIVKQEYLTHYSIQNKTEAMQVLSRAVAIYNQQRPHLSCNLSTPENVHQNNLLTRKLWKNYYKKNKTVNLCQD